MGRIDVDAPVPFILVLILNITNYHFPLSIPVLKGWTKVCITAIKETNTLDLVLVREFFLRVM